MEQDQKRWIIVFLVIGMFFLLAFFVSSFASLFVGLEQLGNVALVPIEGALSVSKGNSFTTETVSSTDIVKQIKKASENPSIKAIVVEINSPGGSPVASKEIADAIKRSNKTTVAVIREAGASGGYWVASAADHVIANEMSITGSIGVIGSYVEFAGLLNRYNMTYQKLTSGKYKDIGDPFTPLGAEERGILLSKISKLHDIFIKEVAKNRNMPEDRVRQIATGEFYLGVEALDLGLVDELGDQDTAKAWLQKRLNLTKIEFAEYSAKKGLFEELAGMLAPQSFMVGRGIGAELKSVDAVQKVQIIT